MKFTKEKSMLIIFLLNKNKDVGIETGAYLTTHPYEACFLMGIVIAELSDNDNDKLFSLPFVEQLRFVAEKTMPMDLELTNSLREVLEEIEKEE